MCQAYAILLFSQDRRVGLVLLCLSFVNPSSGFSALAVYVAARLFAKLVGQDPKDQANPFYLYNPLLVGLSTGYLFQLSPISLSLAISAGLSCLVLSQALQRALWGYFALPILNLPFSLVATLIYLAGMRYGSLFVTQSSLPAYLNWDRIPLWLSGLFHSLGIFVFLPTDVAGIVLLAMFLAISRIQFGLILLSYYSGTLFHGLLYGSMAQAFQDPYNYNFISVGLALGGYFLIASKRTYLLVVLGVGMAALLQDALGVFWSGMHVPVFTFPFSVATLLMLYVLKIHGYSHVTQYFFRTPEENLENWICNSRRFGPALPAPFLPFSGEWTVYQGFDDIWTHQGQWKHAIDFVIEDEETGRTYRREGDQLADYHGFGKPVLAPVSGKVVALEASFPDNPVGVVDSENNWGNYVILLSDFGYYVELSHLRQNSLAVELGQWVAVGETLGQCGNSGYSAQPHLHMQCQYQARAGAPTAPFRFTSAVDGGTELGAHTLPVRGSRVHPLSHSMRWGGHLVYLLDETFAYACRRDGVMQPNLRLRVSMDPWGTQFLEDRDRNARLYFAFLGGRFTQLRYEGDSHSWLRYFFMALPSFPPTEERISWRDVVPGNVFRPRTGISSLLLSLEHSWYSSAGTWSLDETGLVKGRIAFRSLWRSEEVATECRFAMHRSPAGLRVISNGVEIALQLQA
jgi:urea transporter/murein DD-endopeptidase MepM/ murein hydrolase activator NlpD